MVAVVMVVAMVDMVAVMVDMAAAMAGMVVVATVAAGTGTAAVPAFGGVAGGAMASVRAGRGPRADMSGFATELRVASANSRDLK